MKRPVVHYLYQSMFGTQVICLKPGQGFGAGTTSLHKVTCKNCLKLLKANGAIK